MNTEVIKEIANQLGIAVSAVTKDIIPAYASYVIAVHVSKVVIFAIITIAKKNICIYYLSLNF